MAPATFQVGHIAREGTYNSEIVLRNGGETPVDLQLEVANDPAKAITLERSDLTLAARSSGTLMVSLKVPHDATPGRHEPSIVAHVVRPGSGGTGQEAVRVQMPYLVAAADIATVRYFDNGTLWVGFVNGHQVDQKVRFDFRSGPMWAPIETAIRTAQVESLRTWAIWLPLDLSRYGQGATTFSFDGTATAADGTTKAFSESAQFYRRGNAYALGTPPPPPPPPPPPAEPPKEEAKTPPKTVRQVESAAPVVRSDGSVEYGTKPVAAVAVGEELVFAAPPGSPFDTLSAGFNSVQQNVRLEVVSSPRPPDGAAPLPASVGIVTAFQIKAYQDDQVVDGDEVGEVRFGFSFDRIGPAALAVPPDEVVLLHERNEGWRGEPTRRLPDQDDRYRFEASFRSFSAFAVADRRTVPSEMLEPTPPAPVVRLVIPMVVGPEDGEAVVEVPTDMNVTRVRLYIDDTLHGEGLMPPYRFPLSASELSEGDHVARAVVEDDKGVEWTSDTVTFHVVRNVPEGERPASAAEPDAMFLVILLVLLSALIVGKRTRLCR